MATTGGRRTGQAPKSKASHSTEEEKSEYNELMNTFMNLKKGQAKAYSDLVQEAMKATDNILN